jgi:hypothetical protein
VNRRRKKRGGGRTATGSKGQFIHVRACKGREKNKINQIQLKQHTKNNCKEMEKRIERGNKGGKCWSN